MSKLLSLILMTVGILPAYAAEPFRVVLTDTEQNIYEETLELTGSDITPDGPASWSVHKYVLHGDEQEGIDVIDVNNGKFSFTVVPTRGMSIQKVQMGDFYLGLDSPDKILINPKFIKLQNQGNLTESKKQFSEWMVRFGPKLSNDITSDDVKVETLREEIGLMPASQVEVVVEREEPYRIKVRGRIDRNLMNGAKLELWTEVSTEPGSNAFQILDKITNLSTAEHEFDMLYRINFGIPFIGEGARFFGPAHRVTPIDENSASDVSKYDRYRRTADGLSEQVYCVQLWADDRDQTEVMLHNADRDKAISMAFSNKQLPLVALRKKPADSKDQYLISLEPGTDFPRNKRIDHEFGKPAKLSPNQSSSFIIDFTLDASAEQLGKTQAKIAKIWAGRRTKIDTSPEVSAKASLKDIIEGARTWGPAYTSWYGKPAPDFTLADITGKGHTLSDYRGKNVLLIFWATWCGPCLQEIPNLIELRKTVSENDFAMLAISKERLDLVKYFVERAKINYTVLIDQNNLPGPYNTINAIPSSFFIDPEGKIKLATAGLLSLKEIKAILEAK
jgi:peroxiredoxin